MSSLCSFSEDVISQNEFTIDNNEFVGIYLVSEGQVESEVNSTVESIKNSAFTQIISYLTYLRRNTQSNYFISALNTNALIQIVNNGSHYIVEGKQTMFLDMLDLWAIWSYEYTQCGIENPITAAIFDYVTEILYPPSHFIWLKPDSDSIFISGFNVTCTPLEGLLESTLDCLYDIKCLQLLVDYFPGLNQVSII